jgi:hypothetical protein
MAGYTNADLNKNYAFVANIDDKKFWKKYYALNELVFSEKTMDHVYRYPQYVKNVICIDFIPEMVYEFDNLTNLTLINSSEIEGYLDNDDMFFRFEKLQSLTVAGFDVTYINLQLPRLTHLTLINCHARRFHFHESKCLTHLSMENCTFEEKLSGMANLKNLVFLNLHGIPMDNLPFGVYSLTQLRHLDIGNTKISEVRRDFCQLRNLDFLNWSYKFDEDQNPDDYMINELKFTCIRNKRIPDFFLDLIEKSEHTDVIAKIPRDFVNIYTDSDDIVFPENPDEPVDDDEDDVELPFHDFDTEESDTEDEDDYDEYDDVDSGYEDNDD